MRGVPGAVLTAMMAQLNNPEMRRLLGSATTTPPLRQAINETLPNYLATQGTLDPKVLYDAFFVAFDAPVVTAALAALMGHAVKAEAVAGVTDTGLWMAWAPRGLAPC